MRLKLLIFDFDGTLANTIPLCVAAMQHSLLKNTGRRYSRDEIVAEFGISEEGILAKLAPEGPDAAVADFLQFYRDNHNGHHLFPGIEDILTKAHIRGIELAMVTGKGPGSAEISGAALELSRFFNIVRTGNHERDIKADHIRDICAELQIEAKETAYVGDAPSDMVASHEAGVLAIAALWSDTVPAESVHATKPDMVFESVEEFAAWLNGLPA